VGHERSYGQVWFRRDWWARLARGPAALSPSESQKNLDRLLAINRELAQDHDPDRLLERIIDAAIALSGAERGFLILKQDGAPDDGLVVRAARNLDKGSLERDDFKISRSIATEVIEKGAPLSTIDAQGDERFKDFRSVHHLSLRSVLCLPLRSQDGVLGALYLDNRHRIDAFSAADVALLTAFGDQAAIALANARLVTTLAQRSRELETSRHAIEELNVRLSKELEARSAELEIVRAATEVDAGEAVRFGMVGRCAAMREVFRVIERVGDKEVPVSILGESGTGKELVARAIHQSSKRDGTFVSVNCGAIPKELLESELFGHEKGAFTGAVRQKPGLFEIARAGTLFLDEIGELPLDMQVKLLRVLQQKEFRRVGGTHDLPTDARVISATNKDLAAMTRRGEFREDLWYRLNVVELHVPPLRERRDDLPLLIEHLLVRHGGKSPPKLSREVLAQLLDYGWPGNVRELENELQRALALCDGDVKAQDLTEKLRGAGKAQASAQAVANGHSLREVMERFERQTLEAVLSQQGGKITAAARALGLTRAGLYKKLHKYRLHFDKN
jgi:transcriptional regulator with GAF, ATPase, and Fis domain